MYAAQDEAKLEDGAFYLDRTPAVKHLTFGGTTYTDAQVTKLWDQLETMVSASA